MDNLLRLSRGIFSRSGSNLQRLQAVLCAALLWPLALSAQTAGTGTIEGRVRNVGNDKYLNKARITIEGTNREEITNEFGEFRFADVPAGEVKLHATYLGLDPETSAVTVTAGGITRYEFALTSKERYGEEKPLKLDTFVVQSNREYEGNALATNEQRYSPNVKVVMAADAFGDVNEGNPGEFLKYLPGVTVDYVAADVRTVAVRGFPSNFTGVSWDGMRLTSAASGASNRIFEFEQVSINNTSRTEIIKVPTPDLPADSLGGNINFISKSAFERKGAQFNYRVYLNANNEDMDISKTPGPGNKETYKVLPNFDFDYTLPVNDKFGLVITGLSSNQHVEQHRWQPTWNFAQGGATPANPYLQTFQLQDGPKTTNRDSIGIKGDWKITDTQTLSLAYQDNYYHSFFGNRNLNFNVGTTSTTAVAGGTTLQYGPTFVQSATGRASVTQGSSFRDKYGNSSAVNGRYNWNSGDWNFNAGANWVQSRSWYRSLSEGHFSNIGTTLQGVSVVRADNIELPSMDWFAKDASGTLLNPYSLANYRLGTATNDPLDGKATAKTAYADLERHFDEWKVPMSIKAGVNVRQEDRDNRRLSESYTYVGADGVANTADDNAAQYLDAAYSNMDPGFGSPKIQWVDAYKLADSKVNNPAYWVANTVGNETNRINNSEKITETVSAGFIQFDGKLLNNKLRFVAGVRYEKTNDKGEGVLSDPDAVWQKNPDGSYVDGSPTTAGVQRVRKPEAGAVGSLQELYLTRIERGYHADRTYDNFFPSAHLTYNFTDNILARFSYAKTIGRPDYANIIPATDINEDDVDPNSPGTLTIRNTGLKPWTADNYDLSLEYYFNKGGLVTVGGFLKNLKDFWTSRTGTVDEALADELGIDHRFIGWGVSTMVNGGSAQISGAEFNFVRPLTFLSGWGRYFTIKANGTILHLSGDNTPDFRAFISKAGNLGLSFNKSPVVFNINFNYRGRQKGTVITAPAAQTGAAYGATNNFYDYYVPRYNIDVSAEYKINKHFNLFASARNILNKEQVQERKNETSPGYANAFRWEEFGISISAGVKGSF